MSHDRGCSCGKEFYEYSGCTDVSCNKQSNSGRTAESAAPKTAKYDSSWADEAELAEWAFIATALEQAEKLMTHRISWISVATQIARERSKAGWRRA